MANYSINKYAFNNNVYLLEDNRLSDEDITRLSSVTADAAAIQIKDWSKPSTSQITTLDTLTINKLTKAQYDGISSLSDNEIYLITDDTIYATKDYVDTEIANIDALPAQSGNNGKFLITNGTTASWANVDALPSQSGNSGKFLTTNGTTASWASVDLSNYMVKGVDYVTAGQKSGTTLGDNATAEGDSTTASDTGAHAEGGETTASGIYSHAEGVFTTASGHSSHAEGESTIANASRSHAEGDSSIASGNASHAEGYTTTAQGRASHAEGGNTQANGDYTHAEGYGTTAQKKSQHVFGEYNSIDNNGTTTSRGTYVEMVGNGTSASARSNARTLDWSGNESLAGALSLATNKVTMQYNATTHSLDILVS